MKRFAFFLCLTACGGSSGGGDGSGNDGPEVTEVRASLVKCEDGECAMSFGATYSTGEYYLEPPYSLAIVAVGDMAAVPVAPASCDGATLNDGRLGFILAKAPPLQHIALRACVRNDDSGEMSSGLTFLFDVPAAP